MTDEEMADEFAHNHLYYEVAKREDGTEYVKEVSSVTIKQAFLTGLEAGRPKWHKVADGDLPPEDTDVLALLADKEIYMANFYRRNVWDKIGPVIAWCEIPQYTEE